MLAPHALDALSARDEQAQRESQLRACRRPEGSTLHVLDCVDCYEQFNCLDAPQARRISRAKSIDSL